MTLVVMTVSSTYSPVPSCFVVEAQPSAKATNRFASYVCHVLSLRKIFRRHCAELHASHQKQDEYDYQCDIDDSNGSVALTASVRPSRQQRADEKQDQDNQQNGVKANDFLPLLTASASRARPQRSLVPVRPP